MKKPTFSKLSHRLLSIFENIFQTNLSCRISTVNTFQSLKVASFQNITFLTPSKNLTVLVFLFILQTSNVLGQNLKPFTPPRFDTRLKGDMLLIGNNILNRNEKSGERPNDSYNGGGYNSNFSMEYVNVDTDGGKNFSSSTAKLTIPKPACYKIVYAGLYWGAILQQTDRSNIEKVRLKLPGAASYTDINGSIIYDANATPIGSDKNKAYACYADITSLITGLTNAQGDYTVANVISSTGKNGGTGLSAGWSIFVVYEDPTLTAKYITTFDGFSGIGGATTLDIPISGFKTIPTGPVRVKFAFAALEGDQPINGDYLQINGTSISAVNSANTTIRSTTNFFNSSVTYIDPASGKTENFLDRNPKSTNTLGYDAGILNIDNPSNGIIGNNATNATIRLGSTQDVYFYYFNAFAVDIIEPKIVLTKIVKNAAGVDIGNQNVVLGQQLNYEVGFINTGNDDATELTIRDQLPINIIFNYPADLNPLPAGVSVKSYDAATRNIIFAIDKSVVKVGDPLKTISFKVQVVPDCNSLSEACSNSIDNSAYATYKGKENTTFTISDDPSVNTNTGCLLTPKATNFLVGIDGCKFTKSVTLCNDNVDLVAAGGYSSYSWSTDAAGNNVIGTNQTVNVTQEGTYYVNNYAVAPCRSIVQVFTVTRFGSTITNPVIPFADQVVTCPNDGKKLPNIFLCGANATRLIKTSISDGSTIVWEKLNEASCTSVSNQNCANESTSCSWAQVGTGSDYTANASGQYRITLNYSGGCFNRFYFNVFQNLLSPTETHNDIVCNTLGKITVGGVGAGYEYSLDGTNYQASNVFANIATPGFYTVSIRQIGVTSNPCIFTVPDIQIRKRDFTVTTTITQPFCNGDKGTIRVAANDVNPQYNFSIYQGATLITAVGPIIANDYTFSNLTPGSYSVRVSTQDGCSYSGNVTIIEPAKLTATSALTKPLTACSDGEITVTPNGGTSPYFYFINGSSTFQSTGIIPVTAGATYSIKVVDNNNCITTTTIDVTKNPIPLYNITSTNNTCYGVNSGDIKFNVTNANGYTLSYSIDNGVTFQSNPTFSNLAGGMYTPILKYTLNGADCLDATKPVVNLLAPGSAVTASAGVAELAGCDPSGNGFGKVRITNAQGGTPFPASNYYLYSFDGGSTWQTSNEKFVAPGTYTLVIKDAVGCTFTMPGIILDPKPTDPTLKVEDPVFNCDGTAVTTVTVTSPANVNFVYEYYLDNNPNTPITNNVFTGVSSGSHTVSVKYKLVSVPTYSNLLYENFGYGDDTTSPGINTTFYCFERQVVATQCKGSTAINDGDYSVTAYIVNPFGPWLQPGDHTPPTVPPTPKGRSLVVNIGDQIATQDILYQKVINDIIPNQPINFELFAFNLLNKTNTQFDPNLRVALVDAMGVEISSFATGNIPKSEKWEVYPKTPITLDPGANTTLKFIVRSNVRQTSGNDVAIDDIKVYQLPKSCITQKDFPIFIDSSLAFNSTQPIVQLATCNGGNGSAQITAQNFNTTTGFYYSTNDGVSYTNSTTSPVTVALPAGNYKIKVKNDLVGNCIKSFNVTITQPSPVTLSASVTKTATCTTGATITAVGGGGTPAYQYELRASDGVTVIPGFSFSNNAVFTNVPSANYKVFIRDTNLCSASASGVSVNVTAPPAITAVLDVVNSDLCYDSVNKATLVVTVTGGTAPFSYSLDGQAGQNSNTFTNVTAATHSIVITDSNNCTATIPGIVIAPELKAAAIASKSLDCTASSNATIDVTITDGNPAYTYKWKLGAGAYSTSNTVTGNTFQYSTATAGTYTFEITDAKGCTTTTIATIDPITNPTASAVGTDPSCNNGTDGQITITGAGGSGGFTYSFNGGAFTAPAINPGLNAFVGAVNTKDYTYQVKDSKGCLSPVYTITLNNPTPVVASASFAANTTCSTTTVVTLSGAGGSGTYTYNFDGSASYSNTITKTFTNTTLAQTITYSVKDSKGCINTKTIVIPAYNPPTDITFSTPAAISCKVGFTTTSITLTSVGGIGPFTYTVISGPVLVGTSSAGTFSDLTAGNYVFEVKDANGCTKQASKTIDAVPTIAVAGAKTDIKCFGTTDGTATFTITGASSSGNYNYTLSPVSGTINKVGDIVTVTGLGAGTYTLVVTDITTGCTSNTASVTINPATQIVITGVTASNVNCGQSTSNIVVTATGGKPNYKYAYVIAGTGIPLATAFSTNNATIDTGATQSNLSWDVYVMDQNDCIAGPFTKAIIREASPSVKSPAPTPLCFVAGSSTIIDLSTFFNLGSGVHKYTVNGTAIAGTNYTVTGSGTYIIVATDANDCPATATYVVQPELTFAATREKDLDCISDAKISFVASGGTSTYTTYEVRFNGGVWTTPATSPNTYNVAGNYEFRVTDASGCKAISNLITITPKSTPTFAHNETQISCIGGSNGAINITSPTGIAPFTYLITKGATTISTTATTTGLNAGTYTILLTDSKGCTDSIDITLNDPTPLSATVNKTALSCGANNATVGATISVTAPTGGTGIGYQYSFNGGAFSATSTYPITASTGGTVTVVMRDSNNCPQALPTQTIAGLNPPTLEPITGTTIYCAPASKTTSTVTVKATAGTGVGTLAYALVSGPTASTSGDISGVYTGLTAGNYVFKVTDSNGCSASQSYKVESLISISGTLQSQVNVACNGNSTGSAKISVSGFATGNYTATLTTGTGTVSPIGSTNVSTIDVTGLVQGAYNLHLVDNITGCTTDVPFTITEASPLTLVLASNINANCNQALSKVTVTAGGGKLPYSYAYITTATTPLATDYTLNKNTADLNSATPTTYYVWVKDGNGCETAMTPVIVDKDPDVTITAPAQQCFSGSAFSITLAGTGKAPLTYSVNGATIAGTTYSITAAGTYKLGVKDANNCYKEVDYIVEKQLLATAILNKDITCAPAPTAASITVNITNGTVPFSYQMYDGATAVGSLVSGLMTSTFTVNTIAAAGNYSFVVTDSKSCSVTTNVLLVTTPVNPEIADTTIPSTTGLTQTQFISCNGEASAAINIAIDNTKGQAPFVFNIKRISPTVFDYGTQTSGLKAGTYTVTVTDAKGCTDTEGIIITEPDPIVVTFDANPITCVTGLGTSKGSIVVNTTTGGSGTYTYIVTNNNGYTDTKTGALPLTFDLIDFGNYQLAVFDTNSCSWVKQDIPIASPPNSLTLTATPSTPVCGALGSAEVQVGSPQLGGLGYFFAIYTPGITYTVGDPAWYAEDAVNSYKTTIPGLTPGVTYTFIVFDSNTNCYYYTTFINTVPSSSTITATATAVPITCKGAADGSVNLSINSIYGINTDVTYEIFNSATLLSTGIVDNDTVNAGSTLTINNFGGKPTYAGLPYGTYYVLVRETSGPNSGCTITTAPFSITESTFDLEINASSSKNDNCKTDAGVITAIGSKGTGPYQYAFVADGAAAPTVFASQNTFNVEAGDWDVYVKDFNGCIRMADVTVLADPTPLIDSVTPSSLCYTGSAITVTIAANPATLGPITYSVDNGATIGGYGNSSSFNLTPGTYTMNIKDGNGCIASAPYIVKEQLTLTPTLTKLLDCLTASPNATVTVAADGGDTVLPATYAYTITAPAAATGNVSGATNGIFTDLDAGNYTFDVSDGTCTATTTITVDALVPIIPTKVLSIPLCVGGDANVEISATGGTGIYTYQKGAAPTLPTETANIFTQKVSDGTVTYFVKDSKGCVETIDVLVVDPTPIIVSNIDTVQMLCGGGNLPIDATITVTASGGTGSLEYSFDNGANYSANNVYTTTIAGTYDIIVKDANGCTSVVAAVPETIVALDPPVIIDFTQSQMTCPALTSDVTINYDPLHVSGTLTYTLVSGPSSPNNTGDASGTYTGLAAGDYVFRVTDSNFCSDEELFTVKPLPALLLTEQVVANASCNGDNNGSATFTASNLFAPGGFTIVSVVTTPIGLSYDPAVITGDVVTLTGLEKGQYEVTIKDNTTLCEVTKSVTITEPAVALGISAVASNVGCINTISDLSMTPVGGTPNYTYSIIQSGMAVGTYSNVTSIDTTTLGAGTVVGLGKTWLVDVYIKDGNNCTAMTTITITKDDTPTVTTPTLASNQCTVNGNYTFTATGTGIGPLSFSIDSTNFYTSAGTTYTFTVPVPTGASQGYSVTIKDGNGCIATSPTQTTVYKPLTLDVVQDKDITCAALPITGAQFTLTAGDGNPAYVYEVDINGGGFNIISSPYSDNTVGTYVFRVTDANMCSVTSTTINVAAPATPTFSETHIDVSCTGGNNGSITITPSAGVAPYTFALTGTGANNTGDSNGIYTGLIAGSYTVVVTDKYGCTSLVAPAIVIGEPFQLAATTAPFAIKTNCDIATNVKVIASNGTLPYYYDFGYGYDTTDNITVNDNGTNGNNGTDQVVYYSVKDGNGCIVTGSVTVFKLNKPTDLAFALTVAPTCPAPTATVTVTATNGVGALKFEIIEFNGAPPTIVYPPQITTGFAVPAVFAGLIPGDYTFQVTDANGCTYQELYKVDAVINIEVLGQLIADMSCNTGDDGAVTFDVSKFSGDYNYTITKDGAAFIATVSNSSLSSIPLTGLGFGVYEITVHDNTTLCDKTASVTVGRPSIVTISEVSNVNANCKSNALVQVLGAGGTPDYMYAYVKSADPLGSTVFSTSDSASLDPTISTTWDFYAKDSHGCISAPLLVTIAMDPLPAGFTAVATQCPTATGTYTITVTDGPTGMAPYEYSIGTGFQTSQIFTVNAPGTYDLIVKDKFGCTQTFPAVVTILKPLALDTNITALSSCANNDGSITASATGGSGNYSYQLDGGLVVVGATATFPGLASGSHTILVRDTDITVNCTDTVTLNLSAATPVTGFTLTSTPVTCNGGNDGTITATIATPSVGVNDNPVYMYTLTGTDVNGAVAVGPQSSNLFTGLYASIGNYTVSVVSGRGCTAPATIAVTEKPVITVPAPTVVQFTCAAGSNANSFATITVTGVTGGTGTYLNYEFLKNGVRVQFSSSNTYTETNLAGGVNYTVNVFDSNGCVGRYTTPMIINPYVKINKINVVVNQFITCNNPENITATAVDASNNPILGINYVITETTTGVTQSSNTGVFVGLVIGNYSIVATNPVTTCTTQTVHYVTNPNTFLLKAVKTNDVICFGSNEGRVELTIVDQMTPSKAGPFTYVLTDPAGVTTNGSSANAGPFALTGLKAGLYSVTATLVNTPFCSVATSFTIDQPAAALDLKETHTDITCVPGNNGTISVSATGGWAGAYQYQLLRNGVQQVPYGTQTNFENLTAGTYTINVKDSKGCVDNVIVPLANPTPINLTATPSVTLLLCSGDKSATITASPVSGGQGSNYLYTLNYLSLSPVISSGPQSSAVFTGVGAGRYSITATDGWGCSGTSLQVEIKEPTKVVASLVLTTSQTCAPLSTRLTLTANGGTAPYTYSVDANFTSPILMTGNTALITVGNGTFRYYVRDANGCTSIVSNDIKNDPLEPLTISLDVENAVINCKGDATGVIVATATGGLGNYVYTLQNGSGVAIPGAVQTTPGVFTGLVAGDYFVAVKSGVDCDKISTKITIQEPTTALLVPIPTVVPVTCNGNGDGQIIINATGGTGIIKYAIEPDMNQFFESGTFKDLKPGLYDVIVQDENGCYELITDIEVVQPDPIIATVDPASIQQEYCAGDLSGAFTIDIAGGVGPYKVAIDDVNGTYIQGIAGQVQFSFSGLTGGDHTVYIQDLNTCTFELVVPLDIAVLLDPVAIVSYDCVNDLPANKVTVTIDASNNPADVVYSLDSSSTTQISNVFTNLTPGDHFIMAHHINSCVDATAVFTIVQVDPLAITIDLGGLNEIVATTTGGSGVYHYSVNGEDIGSSNKYIYYQSGNYTVTVTDSNGCVASATKYFEFVDIKIPNVFTPNGSGTNDTWEPTNTANYPDIQFVVYDRYSREVGRFGAGQSWDGTYNGTELPMGDYWYVLKLRHSKDDREFIGHFTLYR